MRKLSLFSAVGLLVFVTACTTVDPYTREEKVSRTAAGAGIGAAAGAILGAVTSNRNRTQRAMIGAGIGALAGGAIGNYMDRQEAELRQELEGTGVSVTRVGDNLVLNMPGHITFDVDRTEIKAEFQRVLDSVVLVLNKYEKTGIEVAGHTDSTGRVEYNMELSERRAQSVAHALIVRGVNQVRVAPIGLGPHQPIASNDTAEGRAMNRRVELTLFPLTTG
jgi:outer membrane protein OmpA-like peptidoglycan-associated protein